MKPISAVLAVLPLLPGCLLGPDHERPADPPDLPAAFSTNALAAATEPGAPVAANPADEAAWWAAWNDPLLARLLEEGCSTNIALAQARTRLRQSRAALASSRAALFPTLSAAGSGNRNKTYDPDDSSTGYRAGLDAAWEIDLWGRNRRSAEAAEAEFEAAGLSVEDALLALKAEIAADYVALRLAQSELNIARSNLAAQVESAEIARAKGASGFSTGADVAASDASIATARAALPDREAAVSSAARALEKLLARPPFALQDELAAPGPVPVAPDPPAFAPAEVLARRPDVRRAEASLHAATARVGAARAARLPSINLSAGATATADSLSSWSAATKALSFGASLTAPLFQGGRLAAAEDQARAAADEALLAWHDTALSAVHETQDLWTKLAAERARTADLELAAAKDVEAREAALARYRAGQGAYTDVIVRQTALLAAKSELARHRASLATLTLSLAKALGGPVPAR